MLTQDHLFGQLNFVKNWLSVAKLKAQGEASLQKQNLKIFCREASLRPLSYTIINKIQFN